MAELSPEDSRRLMLNTREAAAALIHDIAYLRTLAIPAKISPDEVRRSSAVVRRLLIESDIEAVSAPRIGRFKIKIPNNDFYYDKKLASRYFFFSSGGASPFGFRTRGMTLIMGGPKPETAPAAFVDSEGGIDVFLSQRVLCLEGKWANRRNVIKYVANVASGVHSGSYNKDKATDELLAKIRRTGAYSVNTKGASIGVRTPHQMSKLDLSVFRYAPEELDPVLLELLAAIRYLTDSPDLGRLEAAIKAELS